MAGCLHRPWVWLWRALRRLESALQSLGPPTVSVIPVPSGAVYDPRGVWEGTGAFLLCFGLLQTSISCLESSAANSPWRPGRSPPSQGLSHSTCPQNPCWKRRENPLGKYSKAGESPLSFLPTYFGKPLGRDSGVGGARARVTQTLQEWQPQALDIKPQWSVLLTSPRVMPIIFVVKLSFGGEIKQDSRFRILVGPLFLTRVVLQCVFQNNLSSWLLPNFKKEEREVSKGW